MIKPLLTPPVFEQSVQTRINSANPGKSIRTTSEEERLQSACEAFESLFINYLFKEMRATVDKSGLIEGGQAESITTSMLDASLSEQLAERGGIGLARMLLGQLEDRTQSLQAPVAQSNAAPTAKPSGQVNRPKR